MTASRPAPAGSPRWHRVRATGARLVGGVAGVLIVALAGCATVSSPLPAAGRPLVVTVTPSPSAAPTPSAAGCTAENATTSLRPPRVLPAPGKMPAGSLMATILANGYLRAGVLTDVPPFDYVDSSTGTSKLAGVDIDIAYQVASAIFGPSDPEGHVRFRAITNAERISVIQDNEVDIVVATMTVNCERRSEVDFSVPYYDAAAMVLVMADSPYTSINDLGGRKVCAATGTTSLDHIRAAASHPIAVAMTNVADCLVALQDGTVDAVSTDDTILDGMRQQDPNTKIVGTALATEPDAIAISLDHPEMTRFVNGVLAKIEDPRNGTWMSIIRSHLGGVDPPLAPLPAPPPAHYRD